MNIPNWTIACAMSAVIVVGCSSGANEDESTSEASEGTESGSEVNEEGSGAEADQAAPANTVGADAVAEPIVEPVPVFEPPVEVPIAVEPAIASLAAGPAGGNIVAGALTLEILQGALGGTSAVEIELLDDPAELDRELPASTIVAALRGGPWNPGFTSAVRLHIPLNRQLEPGMELQLLGWQPAMRAFLVIGEGTVDESGQRAMFPVRQLGDMIVRAMPVRADGAEERCGGDNFGLHQEFPGPSENEVVGLTEVATRVPRDIAFNLLTDFRMSPAFEQVDFKNEEVYNSARTSRNELDHVDEDYLMDPNAAAAVAVLADLVMQEWIDPLSGEAAYRVRITESYDSLIEHSARSTHYQGRAIDLTMSPVPSPGGTARRAAYGRLSRLSECAGFDYVLFENLYHVHASVRPAEFAFVEVSESSSSVVTASINDARTRIRTGHSWATHDELIDMFAWVEQGRFELGANLGGAREYFALQYDATGRQALPELTLLEDEEHTAARATTVDGLREIVVVDGRAYLVNTSGIPQLGSTYADGSAVHIEYPFPVTAPDESVVAVSFQEHPRTTRAFQTYTP